MANKIKWPFSSMEEGDKVIITGHPPGLVQSRAHSWAQSRGAAIATQQIELPNGDRGMEVALVKKGTKSKPIKLPSLGALRAGESIDVFDGPPGAVQVRAHAWARPRGDVVRTERITRADGAEGLRIHLVESFKQAQAAKAAEARASAERILASWDDIEL
jgi:hypothetical protein